MSFLPKKMTSVKHNQRDICFVIPHELPEVGYLKSSYDKRLVTAEKWAGTGCVVTKDIQNEARKGFTFETLNGRYRTEVEFILVRHPDGHVFEVPFQNLLDIMNEVGISVGGVIPKECLMFSFNSKWRVIPVGGAMHKEALKAHKDVVDALVLKKLSAKKASKLVTGDIVKMRDGDAWNEENKSDWVYAGKFEPRVRVDFDWVELMQTPKEKVNVCGSWYDQHKGFKVNQVAKIQNSECGMLIKRSGASGSMHDRAWVNPHKGKKFNIFVKLNKDGKPSNTVAIFKGTSVQIQPTGEKRPEALKSLTNKLNFEAHYVGSFQMYNFGGVKETPADLISHRYYRYSPYDNSRLYTTVKAGKLEAGQVYDILGDKSYTDHYKVRTKLNDWVASTKTEDLFRLWFDFEGVWA